MSQTLDSSILDCNFNKHSLQVLCYQIYKSLKTCLMRLKTDVLVASHELNLPSCITRRFIVAARTSDGDLSAFCKNRPVPLNFTRCFSLFEAAGIVSLFFVTNGRAGISNHGQ